MHSNLSVLCLVTALWGVSHGWYNKFENAVYGGGWTPNRRSFVGCTETHRRCFKSYQCCKPDDVCMTPPNDAFGVCKPKEKDNILNQRYGLKKKDTPCRDSIECADRCCRRKRMGKVGFKNTCGKPGEYTCVGRQILPYSLNDLYNEY